MSGISKFEKLALAMTAAFLLLTLGYFLAGRTNPQPYRVTTGQDTVSASAVSDASAEGDSYPDSLMQGERININTAPAEELCRLPGIGEKRAEAIVAWREEHGPFSAPEELTRVSGIGDGILNQLRAYIVCTEEASAAPDAGGTK